MSSGAHLDGETEKKLNYVIKELELGQLSLGNSQVSGALATW